MLQGDYSSSLTGIYKYVLPPLWITFFGWGTLESLARPDRVSGGVPPALILTVWLAGSAMLAMLAWRLHWLRVYNGVILLETFRIEKEIRPEQLISINPIPFAAPPIVRIRFRDADGTHRSIWFMPAFRWPSRKPADPALLTELRAMVPYPKPPAA
jgi:hypothetical protein